MNVLKKIDGLTELDVCEQRKINGGKSLWYHLSYAWSNGAEFILNAWNNTTNQPSASCNN